MTDSNIVIVDEPAPDSIVEVEAPKQTEVIDPIRAAVLAHLLKQRRHIEFRRMCFASAYGNSHKARTKRKTYA